jgi:predicted AlkP superfamily pyrophosphatase or phosphodiesterase
MKKTLALWIFCLAIVQFGFAQEPPDPPGRKNAPFVVVISLDGFPAYAFDDPRLPVPTLRKLAAEGAIAKSMKPINPTVTWPNHTAMVTGVDASKHLVLFNGLLTRPSPDVPPVIEPWRDKDLMVHASTIYDLAHEAGLTTAQVDWVAIYNARNIDWKFPELPDPQGEIERSLIADGVVSAEQLRTFEDSSQAWQDEMWTDAAVKILETHRPNLLLLHLLTLDDINHQYGPMTQASFTAMALLDANVKRVADVLQRPEFAGRSTLLIVSDHGFRSIQYKIHPNIILQQKGIVRSSGTQTKADAWVIPDGGVAMVYTLNQARKSDLVAELRRIYGEAEGIGHVYGQDEFANLGLPTQAQSDQSPDLLLAAKDNYCFTGEASDQFVTPSPGGTHGYLNTDPKMQAIFLAWGRSVPHGIRLGSISNLDVAPTIAALLNLQMKQIQGHAIQEIGNTAQK